MPNHEQVSLKMKSHPLNGNSCRNVKKMVVLSKFNVINGIQRITAGVSMKMESKYLIRRLILESQTAPDVSITYDINRRLCAWYFLCDHSLNFTKNLVFSTHSLAHRRWEKQQGSKDSTKHHATSGRVTYAVPLGATWVEIGHMKSKSRLVTLQMPDKVTLDTLESLIPFFSLLSSANQDLKTQLKAIHCFQRILSQCVCM